MLEQYNKSMQGVRPILHLIAAIVLVIAFAKYFGVSIPQIRGDWWQLIIMSIGIKAL
jgi:hypothetical protein